ncbi:MAG: UDP-N-acetylmuramoyl-L-alanyl-D-glutamate--2,6-diaminopimelate ligase, partial [Bacteroidota bacterium]
MRLQDLTKGIKIEQVIGNLQVVVQNIQFDSRKVGKQDVFVAVKGTQVDGHHFIQAAIEQGAAAIVLEEIPTDFSVQDSHVRLLQVKNSAIALGQLAANFYGNPSKKLKLVGVTGTNGKTTSVTLLHQLMIALGYKAGLLSTIENKIGTTTLAATHTTPDAVQINALLADMVEAGCDYAFMEVSSHAIHQARIAGLYFAGALFTNLTHDHLDYHGSFKNYLNAKKQLFDELPKSSFALSNLDDRNGGVMLQNSRAKKNFYSLRKMTDFKAKIIENSLLGLQLSLDGQEFHARLIGEFNAYNLLAVYSTALLLGQDKTEVLTALSNLQGAAGRFDYVLDEQNHRTAIVDYAHTPDALEKVLNTINQLKGDGKIITVV